MSLVKESYQKPILMSNQNDAHTQNAPSKQITNH